MISPARRIGLLFLVRWGGAARGLCLALMLTAATSAVLVLTELGPALERSTEVADGRTPLDDGSGQYLGQEAEFYDLWRGHHLTILYFAPNASGLGPGDGTLPPEGEMLVSPALHRAMLEHPNEFGIRLPFRVAGSLGDSIVRGKQELVALVRLPVSAMPVGSSPITRWGLPADLDLNVVFVPAVTWMVLALGGLVAPLLVARQLRRQGGIRHERTSNALLNAGARPSDIVTVHRWSLLPWAGIGCVSAVGVRLLLWQRIESLGARAPIRVPALSLVHWGAASILVLAIVFQGSATPRATVGRVRGKGVYRRWLMTGMGATVVASVVAIGAANELFLLLVVSLALVAGAAPLAIELALRQAEGQRIQRPWWGALALARVGSTSVRSGSVWRLAFAAGLLLSAIAAVMSTYSVAASGGRRFPETPGDVVYTLTTAAPLPVLGAVGHQVLATMHPVSSEPLALVECQLLTVIAPSLPQCAVGRGVLVARQLPSSAERADLERALGYELDVVTRSVPLLPTELTGSTEADYVAVPRFDGQFVERALADTTNRGTVWTGAGTRLETFRDALRPIAGPAFSDDVGPLSAVVSVNELRASTDRFRDVAEKVASLVAWYVGVILVVSLLTLASSVLLTAQTEIQTIRRMGASRADVRRMLMVEFGAPVMAMLVSGHLVGLFVGWCYTTWTTYDAVIPLGAQQLVMLAVAVLFLLLIAVTWRTRKV